MAFVEDRRDEQCCSVGGNGKQSHARGGNRHARHLSTGSGNLRDVQTRRCVFVKVKSCPVRPDEVFLTTAVGDRDIARYFGWRERARVKINERRDEDKAEATDSGRPTLPAEPC